MFELWCWRRLSRVLWTARRWNQSVLKEINPDYSLEGLMLKLMLQYFGHLMRRADSLEKTLMLGKVAGGRRRQWQRIRRLDSITNSMDVNLSKLPGDSGGSLACHNPWGCSHTWLRNWTSTTEGYLVCWHILAVMNKCYKHPCAGWFVEISVPFLVNTTKLDCWIIWEEYI